MKKKRRFKITPSVYLVLIKDGKILLSRRQNSGYFDQFYSLPAGHLEGEETLRQAMIREAEEEIGIILSKNGIILVHTMNRKIPEDERVDFFFSAKKWQGKPKIMEPHKCGDLSWFSLGKLPSKIVPYIKQAIDLIEKDVIYSEREGKER